MSAERLCFQDIRRTTPFRLTIILGSLFAVGVLALLSIVYVLTSRELIARSDRILHSESDRLLAVSAEQLPSRIATEIANGNGFTYLELLSGTGERVVGNISVSPNLELDRPTEHETGKGVVRLLGTRTRAGETIIVGRDIGQVRSLRRRILIILASSGMAILSGVATAAFLLALPPLRRVRDLGRAAQRIMGGSLDVRMPIAGHHDELDQFASTVNVMVDEMERVIAQVRGVTDAIAHDLRTPLTRVRATLSRLMALPDRSREISELTGRAIGDLELVLARFTALLRISEIEAGARLSGFASVDLVALLAGVHELYEPLADARRVTLGLEICPVALIRADEKLLFEAISNLVDNAIKFALSKVTMTMSSDHHGVRIEIRDDGPGIPAGEREAVLRRFHRGTNAEGYPGTGLGLSVVAAIAHLHGHELQLIDADPGLLARLTVRAGAK